MPSNNLTKEPLVVLCVEDDAPTRRLLVRILERRFQTVLAAADGAQGLELYHQHRPALVLTDVQMPRMDGISLARAIRSQDPQARILILTSHSETAFLVAAIEIGASDYLLKPITAGNLDEALNRVFRTASLERRLSEVEDNLACVLESIGDAFFALDPDWRFTYVNTKAQAQLGLEAAELMGRTYWALFPEQSAVTEAFVAVMQQGTMRTVQRQEPVQGIWHEFRIFPMRAGISVYIRDVSEEKRAQDEIRLLAFYDRLTDLPNRTLLQDRLATAILRCKREDQKGAVLFLDLDRFKNINDSLGHETGDLVLKEAAARLQACVRDCDTVARLGGDEFIILVDGFDHVLHLHRVAARILTTLGQEFQNQGFPLSITASIGISLIPSDGDQVEDLLKAADTAMYFSKGKGGNAYHFYHPEMNVRVQGQLFLEGALRKALAHREFSVHYQPQYDLATRRPVGFEALARWVLPDFGEVPPSEFIPLAEETGLIIPLGEWILETACTQAKDWLDQSGRPLRMAVNVSGRQFWQGDLVGTVERVLAATAFPPELLELEITESMLMNDVNKAIQRMTQLAAMGVKLSIDDFGTGYSSLAYLQKFPIHALKIDQSFVRGISRDPDDGAIPAAILALARSMRLEVVAEGIENEDQLGFLIEQGCVVGQGYLFSRPLTAAVVKATILAGPG